MRVPHHAASPSSKGRLDLRVPAAASAVWRVRQAIGALGVPPPLLGDARLLVNELVTNSIRHSGLGPEDRIRVRANWSGTQLRVDVFDRPAAPVPTRVAGAIRPPPGAASGWGLYLVDQLASRWGSAPGRYWFELEQEEQGPERRG